jgi:hypothetical protein
MGWDHTERRKRLAPIGEYRPEVYRVTVHDTFQQFYLAAAAQAVRNGMTVSEFLLFAAYYVLRHRRELKRVRLIFRMGAREIRSAVREPIGPEYQEPDSERERRRRYALKRFQEWAGPELARKGKP